jgi:hypothetical protein
MPPSSTAFKADIDQPTGDSGESRFAGRFSVDSGRPESSAVVLIGAPLTENSVSPSTFNTSVGGVDPSSEKSQRTQGYSHTSSTNTDGVRSLLPRSLGGRSLRRAQNTDTREHKTKDGQWKFVIVHDLRSTPCMLQGNPASAQERLKTLRNHFRVSAATIRTEVAQSHRGDSAGESVLRLIHLFEKMDPALEEMESGRVELPTQDRTFLLARMGQDVHMVLNSYVGNLRKAVAYLVQLEKAKLSQPDKAAQCKQTIKSSVAWLRKACPALLEIANEFPNDRLTSFDEVAKHVKTASGAVKRKVEKMSDQSSSTSIAEASTRRRG